MNDALEVQFPSVNFVREGIKIGILNGLFAMIIMYGSYFIGFNTFAKTQLIASFIPYMIIVLLVYGFQLRKKNGNFLSLKEGMQYTFLSYIIAAIVVGIGTYILFNLMDKNLTQKLFDYTIDKTRTSMEKMGMQESEIQKTIGDATKQKQETTVRTILLGTGTGLIWDFVKSLLITLAIRREKPLPAF